ncbi:MAG: hypothetical protein BWZ10_02288 [candidate division BRC1 bacterium ADurb.BinA364]|nr:MAG: hypothetical protein BWZ10_02288 [candidate division BRC1 bacterium ADurb.BinA364]
MDQRRRAERAQDAGGLAGALAVVGGDADIERLALADGRVERPHGLFERRVRVEPVRVEDVDIVEPEPAQRLVERTQQVLARTAALPIGPGPHVIAGLGRDDQFVAVVAQIGFQQLADGLLGGAARRAVSVGQVEVRNAQVEGAQAHPSRFFVGIVVAEVPPESERNARQRQSAAATSFVGHRVVSGIRGQPGHDMES